MYEQTDYDEIWRRCAQLQRELWEEWTKMLDAYKPTSPWEQAQHNTIEVGVDLLKRLVNIQTDFLSAAAGSVPDLPRLTGQYLEAMRGASDGWLELQRRSSRLWFGSMGQMDPTRYFCTDALMKAAQGWVLPWGKLMEQTLPGQARFMAAAAPFAAAQAPSPIKPQARKERRRSAAIG
ncbi:MAG: hypothetical protein ACREVH_07805 [Gammaproteobacteria bacterium]